jgi:hypothetical protein
MVRGALTRVVSTAGALAATAVLVLGMSSGAVQAAPKPPKPAPKPTTISIVGKDIKDKIQIQQTEQPRLFDSLLSEVNWMGSATKGQTGAPAADKLGPKFTMTVLIKTAPNQVYDLYPMAAGGPRVHRGANQPSGKKLDAWFYGRLTMPEALRVSGVPLEAKPDVVGGGIGGGIGENLSTDELDPADGVNNVLTEMRRLFLLNGAVLVVILFGLAGIAFVIRRRI